VVGDDTAICQRGKFHKNTDLGAVSPDILGYEACRGAWAFVLLKCSACGLGANSLWTLVWGALIRRRNTENLSFPSVLTAALDKSDTSFLDHLSKINDDVLDALRSPKSSLQEIKPRGF